MRTQRKLIGLILAALVLAPILVTGAQAYSTEIQPTQGREVEIRWRILDASTAPLIMWFTGGGVCNLTNASWMLFTVTEVEGDAGGELILGNTTVLANNTEIAIDLALGVWGSVEWWPGLVVRTGEANMTLLNQTAYAAAERVSGNTANGTMSSYYDNVTASGEVYECIVFEYEQDPGIGGNQSTYLAYSRETGILIRGATSVDTGTPYFIEVEYAGLTVWTGYGLLDIASIVAILIVLVGIVVYIQKRVKKPKRDTS